MALVAFGRQRPVNPESIQTGLLDDDKWIFAAGAIMYLSAQRRKLGKKTRDVATSSCSTRSRRKLRQDPSGDFLLQRILATSSWSLPYGVDVGWIKTDRRHYS